VTWEVGGDAARPRGLGFGLDVAGGDGDGEVASGRGGVHQAGDDRVRVVDRVQDGQQHDRDRLAEVQRLGCPREDRVRVAGVGVQVGGPAFGHGRQQRAGVGEHDRVVVDVHDPGVGRDALSHLVGVVRRRDASADVQELPDPGLIRQESHHPAEERPVRL
jgi:hypothetical protein